MQISFSMVNCFFFCLSVVPIATLLKRKTVDVEIDFLPSEKSQKRNRFLRQTSLPANHIISRLLSEDNTSKRLNRLNSSPDYNEENLEGKFSICKSYIMTIFLAIYLSKCF